MREKWSGVFAEAHKAFNRFPEPPNGAIEWLRKEFSRRVDGHISPVIKRCPPEAKTWILNQMLKVLGTAAWNVLRRRLEGQSVREIAKEIGVGSNQVEEVLHAVQRYSYTLLLLSQLPEYDYNLLTKDWKRNTHFREVENEKEPTALNHSVHAGVLDYSAD